MNEEYILLLLNPFIINYKLIFYFFLIFIIACFLVIINYFISKQFIFYEKMYSYECGFDPFEDSRHNFFIQFFIIAILFIIFDLEMIYIFLFVSLDLRFLLKIPMDGFLCFEIFIWLLLIGFLIELESGTLTWNAK